MALGGRGRREASPPKADGCGTDALAKGGSAFQHTLGVLKRFALDPKVKSLERFNILKVC